MSLRDQLSEERKRLQEEGLLPEWFNTAGWSLFKQKYYNEGEESFRGRAEAISRCAAKHMKNPEHWEPKFFELIWNGWLSCSTPVLSNMGTDKGMPVSCSGVYIEDSIDGFYHSLHENAVLSKYGFGTSAYLGDIRPRGSKIRTGGTSQGVLPVLEDQVMMAGKVSQGGTRRGSVASYIPISHQDFQEVYDYIYELPDEVNIGFNWYDSDTENMNNNNREIRRRFKKLMKLRMVQGKGYIYFPEKVNRISPKMYKDLGLIVKASNLCTEINLFSDKDHSFTCVLASMVVSKYNEWKHTDAIQTATIFLDCVASEFIEKAKGIRGLENAVRFTEKGRALGLGVCGFHTYLQQEMIPFESLDAYLFNNKLFKELGEESLKASQWMAKEYGEPEWCKGYGVRNTHRMAIAPTMSTAAIQGGISQGIEPMIGNCFVAQLAGGDEIRVNPVFLSLMKRKGKYSKKLVKEIADNNGSVQNLDWLSDIEKLVFKTPFEMNQESILNMAAGRQKAMGEGAQGQSLNLFFSADEDERYVAYIHRLAITNPWILALYYVRSKAGVDASKGCVACT
jgi:ribonucleoside-diphosphate reductase alpha chain